MEYQFRLAAERDTDEVIKLYLSGIQHLIEQKIYQWDEIYPNEKVIAGDIMNREMYVLSDEAQILSCVVLNEDQDISYQGADWKYTGGRIAVIHRLCVKPECQGRRIGRRTMEYAEQLIKATGYSSIRLDAFSDNYISRNLYEKLGYRYAGTTKFRKGQFYLMEKSCSIIMDKNDTAGGMV